MSRQNSILILVGLAILILVFWWAQSRQQIPYSSPLPTESPVAQPTTPATSSADQVTVNELIVEVSDFKLIPAKISLKKGEKVKIILKNNGKLPHNLTITELGVATKTISGGQEDSLEFIPAKDGQFSMFCSVGNHRQKGVEGNVVVE